MTTAVHLLILAATITVVLTTGVLLARWQENRELHKWAKGMRNDAGDGEAGS